MKSLTEMSEEFSSTFVDLKRHQIKTNNYLQFK